MLIVIAVPPLPSLYCNLYFTASVVCIYVMLPRVILFSVMAKSLNLYNSILEEKGKCAAFFAGWEKLFMCRLEARARYIFRVP